MNHNANVIQQDLSSSTIDDNCVGSKEPKSSTPLHVAPIINDNNKRMADGTRTRKEKQKKWESKRQRREKQDNKELQRQNWFRDHAHFASLVTDLEMQAIPKHSETNSNNDTSSTSTTITHNSGSISSKAISDWICPYVDIKEGTRKSSSTMPSTNGENKNVSPAAGERLFIAEGVETVRLLIQQSVKATNSVMIPIQVKSIFVKPSTMFEPPVELWKDIDKLAAEGAAGSCEAASTTISGSSSSSSRSNDNADMEERKREKCAPPFHVLVASEAVLSNIAGFPIARGALACGVVPRERDEAWLETFVHDKVVLEDQKEQQGRLRLLALDGICDTSNLGSMIRCASAFGIDAIVLSQDCCDVWYRRTIRVSMGHVFRVPVVRVQNLAATIQRWCSSPTLQMVSFAAVIALDAELLLENLERNSVSPVWCCVLGNEGNGISQAVEKACSTRIRISMASGVDSLSVPVATGILLHGLCEREKHGN